MTSRIMDWISRKQRAALNTDKVVGSIEARARSITQDARDQRAYEMRIAEMSPSVRGAQVNPVYDRIKGRPL
jgi:hypothetical protein